MRQITSIIQVLLCLYMLLFPVCTNGQSINTPISTDTGKIFSWNDFWQIILNEHPEATRASNLRATAKATLLSAKGGFDPKMYGDFDQKSFDNKNYFTYTEGGLKIPTWLGIEAKVAYSTARGDFINPADKLPLRGQGIIGISLPLLQGLVIDQRRADLLSARQNEGLKEMEWQEAINDLQYEAAKVYWKWVLVHAQLKVYQQSLVIAENRLNAFKTSFELGERMEMDTLEAYILVQDRSLEYLNAATELQKASYELANFLWQDNRPLEIINTLSPAVFDTLNLTFPVAQRSLLLENLVSQHPSLKMYQYKLSQLNIERKWKTEKLKPKLNINYNFLGNGASFNYLFTDNYKWGIQFSSSTLFRNERGEIQLNEIKQENTQLMLEQKTLELNNKLANAFAAQDLNNQQIALYTNTLDNYRRLLEAEYSRLELGESSLFLINNRESKYIEAQLKLLKFRYENEMIKAGIRWAGGGKEIRFEIQ